LRRGSDVSRADLTVRKAKVISSVITGESDDYS